MTSPNTPGAAITASAARLKAAGDATKEIARQLEEERAAQVEARAALNQRPEQ